MSERVEPSETELWGDVDGSEALRRYRALVDAVDGGIFQLDADGRFVTVDETIVDIAGRDRDELVDEHVSLLFDPADVERIEREGSGIAAAESRNEPFELSIRSAGGETIPCELRTSPLVEDGAFRGTVGIVSDVGERDRAEGTAPERERRRELQQYRTLTEAANDVVVTIDEESTIRTVNPAVEDVFGYEPAELIGESLTTLMPERLRERHRESFARYLETGERTVDWDRVELTGARSDGSEVPVAVSFGEVEYGGERFFTGIIRDVTERREMETELRERERRLSRLVENVPGMVYRCRNERGWPMEFVSDACEELTGHKPEALERGEVSWGADVMVQDDREGVWETVQRETDDGGMFSETYRIETEDGERRWVRDYGRGVFDDGGNLVEIEGIIADVTERKRAEQRLAEERDMFAEGPVMVFRWKNEEGWPVEHVSENVEDVLGYAPAELESGDVPYTDLLLEEEIDRITGEVEENSDGTTERFSHEPYRVVTADGDVQWVKDTTKIVRDETGDITHYLGYLVDVTDRKERERELERYETLFTESTDVNAVLSPDGTFQYLPPSVENVLGYEPGELVGENAFDYVHPEDRERIAAEFGRMVEDPEYRPKNEFRYRHADGSWVWLESRGRNLLDDPDIEGLVAYTRDVTERKERERDLQRTERRFEAIFEDPNILVGLLEPDGTVLDINRTAMEYVDADLEEVTGEPFWETPWWGEGDGIGDEVREWTERAATGEYVEFQADLTRPTGEEYTLEGYFRPVTDDDGDVVSIIVSDRDVTERMERERDLERAERRYRTLVENFPNGAVALVDEDLRYRTAGGRPVDVEVETGADLEGKSIREAVSTELADVVEPRYRAALEGESSTFEYEHAGDYSRIHVFPVRDDDGEVFAAMGMSQDITDLKERERDLEESERRYRTLAEYFPNGIVTLFDDDLEYELAAGRGFEDIPVDPDDLEGHPFDEAWDEATAEALRPAFEAALEGEERSVELAYEGREWILHAVPITDERGDVFAGMTMAQDVTERKERERYLEDAKARLEAATEAGAVGTWEWYVQEDSFTAGPTFAETFDVDPEAAREGVSLDAFLEAIHEDDRDRVEREIEDAVESCDEYEAEYRVRNADGEIRWVVARGHVECDEDGSPTRFPGAITDITERKRAELELQRNNEHLETLFELLPVGVIVVEADGEMVAVNDTAREVWGGDVLDAESVEEYAEYPIYEAETGDPVPPREVTLGRVLRGEEVLEPDVYEIEAADGERRIVEAKGMPIRNAEGEVTRGVATLSDVTERHEYQRRLEQSEQRYRTLVENFPNGAVGLFDEDLRYRIVGGEVLDEIGPSAEDVVGRTVRERYPEELADEMVERFRAALDGETRAYQYELHDRHWQAYTVPVEDEEGEVFGGMVMVQDITERREQRRQLEQSEQRYRTLAENFPDGAVAVYDHDLRYELVQGDVLDDALPGRDEVEGKTVREVFPEALVDDLAPLLRTAVEDGETVSDAFEFAGRHWRTVATPLRDADGEIFAGLSYSQDVTEQVERERELERALDLLNKTERIADVAGWEVDPETMEPYWSDNLFDLLDVSYDDQPSLEEALDVYYTEADRATVEAAIEEALDTGDPFDVETRFPRPSGDVGWLRIRGDPEVEGGEVVTLRGALQDVTERKRREHRLEEAIENLEESNERLEQFAYAASHDLQEPLRMVSSYLQLIEARCEDDLDEDGREFLEFAVDGAERMRAMIDGLLEYSRIETRGDPFEPVELDEVLEDVLDDVQIRIEESDAEITAEDLPRVEGDASQLRQVFQNLLDNAIEYAGDEPPRIHVSAERGDARRGPDRSDAGTENDDEWTVSVRDEGIGIDADDQERIFEVFNRLHSHDEHAGTGIGLALCERIVERHDGWMWVDSTPGEGATFSFTLPAADGR